MKRGSVVTVLALVALAAVVSFCVPASYARDIEERSSQARWYFEPAAGFLDFEGDEAVDDGFLLVGRLGYDWSDWFSWEGSFYLAPNVEERFVGQTTLNADGSITFQKVSRADPDSAGFGDTYAAGVDVNAVWHFTPFKRFDPFLLAGGGLRWYGEKINGESFDPNLFAGGGVMYNFNDEWAVRGDYRAFVARVDNMEANSQIDFGVVWHWGAGIAPDYRAVEGPLDSDRDGLYDTEEKEWGTDMYDPDTDKDGLKDGPEVKLHHTDPLNPDTDWDGLSDGDEVNKYTTNPLEKDTDKGGVTDGHEVLEDGTDPRDGHGSDDLIKLTLYIQFDYDKAVIKPQYFNQLDIIANKMLKRYPGTTAKIEGHADKLKKSTPEYNLALSDRRAKAVLDYVSSKWKIESDRLASKGYGFSMPMEPNDPVAGNPKNRRVEVYIKGLDNTSPDIVAAKAEFEDAAPDVEPDTYEVDSSTK